MEKKNWRSSSRNPETITLNKSYSEHPFGRFMFASPKGREERTGPSRIHGFLKMLRRKFRKEKRCFGSGRHSNPVIVPYNSYTYKMNFDDQGLSLAEPDENLCRSFSARFAGPSSNMFNRIQSVR